MRSSGAKLPTGEVSHCFALNGNEANPFCGGIQGVVGAYYQAIGTLELWGPTSKAACFSTPMHTPNPQSCFHVPPSNLR